MNPMEHVYIFPLSLLLLLLLHILYLSLCRHRRPNQTPPCPQSYPIIGNLIAFLRNRHRFHDWATDMLSATPTLTLQVHGFLSLSHGVCTADPANLQHILRTNFPNFIKGPRFHSILHDLLGNGIFNADGPHWSTQRKIASHEFTTNSLKHFISTTVQSHLSTHLIPHLLKVSENETIIDLQEVLQDFTFRNICSVAFGFELQEAKPNSELTPFVEAFNYAVEHSSERFMSPFPFMWKMKRFFNVGSERKYGEAIGVINDFAMDVIRSKEMGLIEMKEKSEDLLSRFMVLISDDHGFSDGDEKRKFLRDIVISFVLAGKDTTSTALTWFFWLIAGHPHCDRLIYNELSKVGCTDLSYNDLKKIHYLHAALSESMRLFPPLPINTRLTVENDTFPDGTHVGKGWFADYSAYAMGRMEKLWGHDCREYRPERWLDGDGVYVQLSGQFKYPVFHGGPRTCLGKDMAYVQMKYVAAAVMREFEILAVDGGGTAERMMEPPYTLSLLLKMRGGLRVMLKRRRQSITS